MFSHRIMRDSQEWNTSDLVPESNASPAGPFSKYSFVGYSHFNFKGVGVEMVVNIQMGTSSWETRWESRIQRTVSIEETVLNTRCTSLN